MSRKALAGVIAGFALLPVQAFAADYWPEYGADMRGSYNSDWDMSDIGDPLDFEVGIRYFYSVNEHDMTLDGNDYDIDNQSHALELHGRIDDHSSGAYLKGYAGFTGLIYGTMDTPLTGGSVDIDSGQLGYLLVDYGFLSFGTGDFGFGPFVGYQYLHDSVTSDAPDDTVTTDVHMLRLGLAAKAEISDVIDFQAEVAFVPYGYQQGSTGNDDDPEASLMGITGEAMAGFHATDELTIRAGGRVWYLTDSFDDDPAHQNLRYGALVELTYTF